MATGNSAEFGRSAGANVNVAIKSGSRDLHGSVYWYVRNDKFDANEFFANRQGSGKVPFRQNQYGVSVGGPVVIPKPTTAVTRRSGSRVGKASVAPRTDSAIDGAA